MTMTMIMTITMTIQTPYPDDSLVDLEASGKIGFKLISVRAPRGATHELCRGWNSTTNLGSDLNKSNFESASPEEMLK